jgi:hypothetical protein
MAAAYDISSIVEYDQDFGIGSVAKLTGADCNRRAREINADS